MYSVFVGLKEPYDCFCWYTSRKFTTRKGFVSSFNNT